MRRLCVWLEGVSRDFRREFKGASAFGSEFAAIGLGICRGAECNALLKPSYDRAKFVVEASGWWWISVPV